MWILRALVAAFVAGRMNKSGTQGTFSTTAEQITGWTADGSYPGTSIVSNKLRMTTAGSGLTVSAACVFTTNNPGLQHNMGIWKNNVQIGSTVSLTANGGTLTLTPVTGQTVAVNDDFEMRCWITTAGGTMTVQASGTFVKVE